ncbi:hypothetical protein FAF44_47295 [Nonomuraea sp. MG754425]|nr:hypothetical protein [Nonomuraea sp. MG754425]
MRATLIYGAGDVRVENVPDPVLRDERPDRAEGPRPALTGGREGVLTEGSLRAGTSRPAHPAAREPR